VPVAGEVVLLGEEGDFPVLTVESANEKSALVGKVEAISAKPGSSVIFEANPTSATHYRFLEILGFVIL
jgi:hypothetical protein